MKSILDPSFRYTASFNTDLRKTFARIRCSQQQDAAKAARVTSQSLGKVTSIVGRAAATLGCRVFSHEAVNK